MLRPLLLLALLAAPYQVQAAEPAPSTIALTARGTASAAPDTALVSLAAEARADTAAAALGEASAAVGRALAALRERGVEPRDVQTTRFEVQPVVVYPKPERATPEEQAPRVVGYRVVNGLDVRLRDVTSLGAVLDEMVGLGMTSIGAVRFTLADPEALEREARRNAVNRATMRARTLAEAAGVALGPLVSIREGTSALPVPMHDAAIRSARAMEAVPIAAGETEVAVTVRMEWEIAR